MAKRNSRMSKIEPSVMTLVFNTPATSGGTTGQFTIDLSQCASIVNRRFYRQGLNWAVAGMKIISTASGSIIAKKLPNTWVMSNAWEKSFRAWQRMNNEALAEAESVRPRFLDFKVYADSAHHTSGFADNLLPLDASFVDFIPGEWDASKVVIPFGPVSPGNTTEHEFIATGVSFPGVSAATGLNAVSLIEGYAASRGLPNTVDPNTPADADDADGSTPENWLSAMFNDGTDRDSEVLANMITEGNRAPYPYEGDGVNVDTMYPNGANQGSGLQIHDWVSLSGTTIGGQSHIKGGNFPCGLVRLDWTPETTANFIIQLDLIPGNHRGYLCEPMREM